MYLPRAWHIGSENQAETREKPGQAVARLARRQRGSLTGAGSSN